MENIDWLVLLLTLGTIIGFGLWKGRIQEKNIEGYLLADRQMPWYHVTLSVMATQASAITFLSAPGQAYTDGMRFVQFYFGLPLAMIVLSITFIPIFKKLNVFTAYEFLEGRFDLKTRVMASFLFLIPRALSTGVTIAAPSIILSTILGWNLYWTNIVTGIVVTIYCMYGGSKTISYTQMQQMLVVMVGMFLAGYMVVHLLPTEMGFVDTLKVAGKMDKLDAIDWKFDLNNRYNVWSGLIGGFFLQLSYFGTDQSQVSRYLSGESIGESRLGLLMNGIFKIPMQFLILLIGSLVFVFYQFHEAPLFFNKTELGKVEQTTAYKALMKKNSEVFIEKKKVVEELYTVLKTDENTSTLKIKALNAQKLETLKSKALAADKKANDLRKEVKDLMLKTNPDANINDTNYIFLSFVTKYMPQGMVGLLIAVILLASMGAMASAFSSLTSCTIVDIYQRMIHPQDTEKHYVNASKLVTLGWGIVCIVVAQFTANIGSLIEAVNILGSWFYGTILGVFLVAFYIKSIKGDAVFWAALLAEVFVIYAWWIDLTAFLWLNVIGCVLVVGFSWVISLFSKRVVS
ncbi:MULTISPECIES: sodium:solute symporter [unclassified Arcicella]|uniref:sodium:solute symporter n=1 Tax=unclassified Arcicella TaxID=2644986 RepID=UPI002861AF39|nr:MULTISPECIES: sodium:solute symporter [unclassified Arcicella]MDR6560288.1 SSS family transporter [Arcicella sp. BE51]MDR6810106.1 SSS family transporter [Arcicella sp. BE140]MDR6821455.1 SSS family transporter [Arcicella sp. BE139]